MKILYISSFLDRLCPVSYLHGKLRQQLAWGPSFAVPSPLGWRCDHNSNEEYGWWKSYHLLSPWFESFILTVESLLPCCWVHPVTSVLQMRQWGVESSDHLPKMTQLWRDIGRSTYEGRSAFWIDLSTWPHAFAVSRRHYLMVTVRLAEMSKFQGNLPKSHQYYSLYNFELGILKPLMGASGMEPGTLVSFLQVNASFCPAQPHLQ